MTILPMEIRETMRSLEERTDHLLSVLRPGDISDAINWANLNVVQVVYCVSSDGCEWYTVEVEEASPEAIKLHEYLYKHLGEGWGANIEIRTEW